MQIIFLKNSEKKSFRIHYILVYLSTKQTAYGNDAKKLIFFNLIFILFTLVILEVREWLRELTLNFSNKIRSDLQKIRTKL